MQPPRPYRDERPWGEELWLTKGTEAPAMVKILTVKPGEILSLQRHAGRDEFWHVLSGNGFVTIGSDRIQANPGDEFFAPRATVHRMEGGSETLSILELAFGTFDESDIERLEDKYGRA